MQTLRGLNRTPWAICLAICLAFWAQPSDAAFPGANGKIAFAGDRDAQGNLDIYVMAAGAALALSGVVLIRSARAPSEGQG